MSQDYEERIVEMEELLKELYGALQCEPLLEIDYLSIRAEKEAFVRAGEFQVVDWAEDGRPKKQELVRNNIGKPRAIRVALFLRSEGFSIRQIMRLLNYKSPRSVQDLLEDKIGQSPRQGQPNMSNGTNKERFNMASDLEISWMRREKQLYDAAELRTALLDSCYDAICNAIYDEDGLDGAKGVELLDKIKSVIGLTPNVKSWEPEHEERKTQFR